jgi:hypothetical protein
MSKINPADPQSQHVILPVFAVPAIRIKEYFIAKG